MTDKNSTVEKARALIVSSPRSQIDLILATLGLTHEEYRQHYPDTPVTVTLALDVLDARDIDGLTTRQIARRWNLNKSQLHYALYNDRALKQADLNLARLRIETALRNTDASQTEIAEQNNVSQSYVHRVAKELGVLPSRKKRSTITDKQVELIKQAIDDGATVDSQAKLYGVARDTIYKRLRNL